MARGWGDKETYYKAAAEGFYCMSVPEKYGGKGMHDFRYNCIVQEVIDELECNMFIGFPLGNDMVVTYFTERCTPAQEQMWLPQIAKGAVLAVAMSEPHAASDLQGIATAAVKDGDDCKYHFIRVFCSRFSVVRYVYDLQGIATTAVEKKKDGRSLLVSQVCCLLCVRLARHCHHRSK
jgi:hypothetical protein